MLTPPIPGRPSSNTPYLIAAVVMALIAVIAVLGILYFRGAQDNTTLITLVLGFLSTITTGIMAFMKSQETHLSVNSRLDAFVLTQARLSHAEGKEEGIIQGRANAVAVLAAAPTVAVVTPAAQAIELTPKP